MLFQGSGWAYSNDNDVVMLGVLAPTTLLHEAAHAFDDAGSRSYTDLFKKAVELDSCWADNYAKSTGEKVRLPPQRMISCGEKLTVVGIGQLC